MLRVLACLAFSAAAVAQLPLPQRYRDAGVLRWASDAEGGAPFVFLDPARPELGEIGFEVEIADELGKMLGIAMRRVQAPFANLVQTLERDDCDFAMNGLEPTDARRVQVRFTRPYYVFQQQLSVAPGTTGVRTLADLAGKRVGALGESQSHKLLLAHPGIETVVYESSTTAYEDVLNGRTVAALADLPIARGLRPLYPRLVDVGEPFGEDYYVIAVRMDGADLQAVLDEAVGTLIANGTLERIYRKWNLWVPAEARLAEPEVVRKVRDGKAAEGAGEIAWGPAMASLGKAALVTFGISVASFALAVVVGLCIALVRLHGPLPLRWCAVGYVEMLRGTPILVQLLLLYYGLGSIGWLREMAPFAWVFKTDDYTAVRISILGLALNYSAYEAEIYRGALLAIPRGQREAAQALGLTTAQSLRHVIVPQALRLSLAPSTNDFIALFKDSSIVMVITVVELTKQYQMLANASGRFIVLGFVTCGLYLCMSLPLAFAARRFERRLDKDRA
ncbi:MAG TPA: ABC transporter substrate-binding protein/permease [Planctomycetota bacterium]